MARKRAETTTAGMQPVNHGPGSVTVAPSPDLTKIEFPASTVEALKAATGTTPILKCECPVKDSFETCLKTGGHCTKCGRGVHTPMAASKEFGPGFFGGDGPRATQVETAAPAEPFLPAPSLPPPATTIHVKQEFRTQDPDCVSETFKQALDHAIAARSGNPDAGDTVNITIGEEMYGKQGTFSSYRVGPVSGSTRIRESETRGEAIRRLRAELAVEFDAERELKKAEFIANFQKAFG